jgi:hypothetical protein
MPIPEPLKDTEFEKSSYIILSSKLCRSFSISRVIDIHRINCRRMTRPPRMEFGKEIDEIYK